MNKNLVISIAITICYAIITLIGVLNHEIWADEAQVWQLAKYLSIPELINHLHNEGHPSLFYILLMPFAKITSNILCMQLVCWGAMCMAVFLLMYFAPFRLFTKFAIILSAGFIYFLPVIARSYSLIPVLVFLAAILYSKQKQHPIIYATVLAAIANIHIIMFVFVSVLLAYFAYDNIYKELKDKKPNEIKQYIIAAGIICFGLLCVFLQLHNTTSSNSCISFSLEDLPLKITKAFSFFFINAYNKLITVKKTLIFPLIDLPLILTLMGIFISFYITLFKKNKRLFILAFLAIGFQFAIYTFAYNANTYVTRIFSAFIILIFCFWVLIGNHLKQKDENPKDTKKINILIAIFFILTSYNGINYYINEIKYEYAGGKKAAEFIRENIKKDSILLVVSEPFSVSLAHYLDGDYEITAVIRNKVLKYVIWDEQMGNALDESLWVYFAEKHSKIHNHNKDVYVIKTFIDEENEKKINGKIENSPLVQVFHNNPIIEGKEGYIIYKYERK